VSGPSNASFGSAGSAATTVSGLLQGSYTFRLTVTDNAGAFSTGDVTITVNAAGGSTSGGSIRIEAENFTSMSGIQTENTYDAGGGQNVGWQDNNEWMD
jgi:endoglucanase